MSVSGDLTATSEKVDKSLQLLKVGNVWQNTAYLLTLYSNNDIYSALSRSVT